MTQDKALETVILPAMTPDDIFMLRDALAHRLEDVREVAVRFFGDPSKSAKSAREWANFEEFKQASQEVLNKLPEIETPEGEPARFVHKPQKAAATPITDIEVYRVTLEACVHAETSDMPERAEALRAIVDASPFEGCPKCDGRPAWRNEPACSTCNGDGFIASQG